MHHPTTPSKLCCEILLFVSLSSAYGLSHPHGSWKLQAGCCGFGGWEANTGCSFGSDQSSWWLSPLQISRSSEAWREHEEHIPRKHYHQRLIDHGFRAADFSILDAVDTLIKSFYTGKIENLGFWKLATRRGQQMHSCQNRRGGRGSGWLRTDLGFERSFASNFPTSFKFLLTMCVYWTLSLPIHDLLHLNPLHICAVPPPLLNISDSGLTLEMALTRMGKLGASSAWGQEVNPNYGFFFSIGGKVSMQLLGPGRRRYPSSWTIYENSGCTLWE
jgi:hypothetical protein